MHCSMTTALKGVALVLTLAGSQPAAGHDTPVGANPIEGRDWRLITLRGLDPETLGRVEGGVNVRFAGGQVQGFGGCNRLTGSYTVAGDQLTIAPLARTMMACAPPASEVENAFTKAFAGTLGFLVDDHALVLTLPSASEPTLVFIAAPPPRIDGVTWEVTGYNNGRQAVVSPIVGSRLTVTFDGAAVTGSASCNTFRADYTVNGDRITIAPPATSRKQCSEEIMVQEGQFLSALQSATVWALDRGMLDMHRADGERVVHAKPTR